MYPGDYRDQLAPGIAGRLGLSRELIRGAGLALATYAFVWGAWIACPWFDVFTTKVYDHYREYPEWVWGGYGMVAGWAQFAGLARHVALLSFAGAVLLVALFLFGSWNFLLSDWRSPGFPIFLAFMAWEILIADTKGRTAPNVVTLFSALAQTVAARRKRRKRGGGDALHG